MAYLSALRGLLPQRLNVLLRFHVGLRRSEAGWSSSSAPSAEPVRWLRRISTEKQKVRLGRSQSAEWGVWTQRVAANVSRSVDHNWHQWACIIIIKLNVMSFANVVTIAATMTNKVEVGAQT